MKRVLLPLIVMLVVTLNSFAYDIKNAKIGSTIVSDWNTVGHAAVVVKEYTTNSDPKFIIGSHEGGVRYDSFDDHLEGGDTHLGHFRAVERNYTFKERKYIRIAAERAVKANTKYEFKNLYSYGRGANYFNDNIPRYITRIPTKFRCDGLTEWVTEVGMNRTSPKESDGFYENNNLFHQPKSIAEKASVDKIGTPDKPKLSLADNQIDIEFPKVSGAWSKALYAVYKGDSHILNISDKPIYCGSDSTYIDKRLDEEKGMQYYYHLKVGERTASCETMNDFSEESKPASLDCKPDATDRSKNIINVSLA